MSAQVDWVGGFFRLNQQLIKLVISCWLLAHECTPHHRPPVTRPDGAIDELGVRATPGVAASRAAQDVARLIGSPDVLHRYVSVAVNLSRKSG